MELTKIGGMVYEKCPNPACINKFPYDVSLKIENKLNKHYEETGNFENFVYYFRYKDSQMRAKYIGESCICDGTVSICIEVANLTRQPEFKSVSRK